MADAMDLRRCLASADEMFSARQWCAHRCGLRGGLLVVVGGGVYVLVALGSKPVGAASWSWLYMSWACGCQLDAKSGGGFFGGIAFLVFLVP